MNQKLIPGLFFLILVYTSCTRDGAKFAHPADEVSYGSNAGKYVTIQGKKIYYEEYGTGTPLLLLSGGGLTRSIKDFEKCIPEWSKHFRVIAPDSPGQGRSEQADTLTYPILREFMSQFVDSVIRDSAYVVGWSDGAITGILLAAQKPEKIRKVIAVGANNGLANAIPSSIPIDSVYPMSTTYYEKVNKTQIETYIQTLPRDWKRQVEDLNVMWYERDAYFPDSIYEKIPIPVMIVLGDRDDITTEHGLQMHRAIKNSQFCVLPNTSHEVFSESADLITKIATDFFKK